MRTWLLGIAGVLAAILPSSHAASGPVALAELVTPMDPACAVSPQFDADFAGNALDDKWSILSRPFARLSDGELEGYGVDGVTVSDGKLRLTAERSHQRTFLSGRIHSRKEFQFGCYEVVARLPRGRGLWPAIWLRTAYNQPANGEIDILEGFGSHPGVYQGTLHRWVNNKDTSSSCARTGSPSEIKFGRAAHNCEWQPQTFSGLDFSAQFHRFGVVWTPKRITWLLDGHPFYSLTSGVPNRPMIMVLNLAVGGVFDGSPDSTTAFPAVMTVRSVRVWPLK